MYVYEKELHVAIQLAFDAGQIIMGVYNQECDVDTKHDKSPVTIADKMANEFIVNKLKKEFPEHGILAEESDDNFARLDKEFVWIIDPLDGTKEFIKKNGEFTVNIAMVKNKIPVLGVVYAPVVDKLYYAVEHCGSYLVTGDKKQRIHASSRNKINDMVVALSRSHTSVEQIQKIEVMGFSKTVISGSSIKGCLIAQGVADVYYRLGPIKEWDICAMHVVLNEAGAKMTLSNGDAIYYNKKDILFKGVIASNNQLHEEIVSLGNNG